MATTPYITADDIDDVEGLLQLLAILATKTRARSDDLLPEWGDFLGEYSNFGTTSTIKDTLRRRLANLVERDWSGVKVKHYTSSRRMASITRPRQPGHGMIQSVTCCKQSLPSTILSEGRSGSGLDRGIRTALSISSVSYSKQWVTTMCK